MRWNYACCYKRITDVLGDSIWFNLEILSGGSLFAGVTDSSNDLSSGWFSLIDAVVEITSDNVVLDGVVGVAAEYTWSWVNLFLSMAFLFRGYIPHFLNPVLIMAVDIDSHGYLNSFVKFVLQQFTGFFHPSVESLICCVKREKCDFTGWIFTTSRGWNIWVVCGSKQYKSMLLALHSWIVFMSKWEPWPSKIKSFWPAICLVFGMNSWSINT